MPEWPIQRLVAAEPEFRHRHLVLFRIDSRKGKRVTAASPLARRAGVRTEMPLNEANSLLRRAAVEPDPKNLEPRNADSRNLAPDSKQQREQRALEFHIFEHDSAADLAAGPSTLFGKRREERLLLEALRRIPLDSQVVLELYYWEEMSAAQTAAVLDLPEGTVRGRVKRAKDLLQPRHWYRTRPAADPKPQENPNGDQGQRTFHAQQHFAGRHRIESPFRRL